MCRIYLMLCPICYHLYHLKNVTNTIEECYLACNFTKSNTPPWVFLTFLNCANGTKSRNASHIMLQFFRESINIFVIITEMELIQKTIRIYITHFFICGHYKTDAGVSHHAFIRVYLVLNDNKILIFFLLCIQFCQAEFEFEWVIHI